MDILLRIVSLFFSGIAVMLTVLMLLSYRKERSFPPLSMLFSGAMSLIILVVFIAISGAKLNQLIAIPLFIFGALFGVIRGFTVKLYYRDDRVVGKYSLLSLLGWGGSYVLAILLNSFDSVLMASLGLAPLWLATGTQVFLNATLFLRRLFMRAPRTQAA